MVQPWEGYGGYLPPVEVSGDMAWRGEALARQDVDAVAWHEACVSALLCCHALTLWLSDRVCLLQDLPDGLRTVVQELRAHPAGQYAMRMFRLHRGDRQVPGEPALRIQPPHDMPSRPSEGRSGGGGMGPGVV